MSGDFPSAMVDALATVITDAVAECDNGPGLYPHEARQIATAALSALPAAVQAVICGEAVAVRHKKRGTTYAVVGDATLQTGEPLTDNTRVVVYRGADGALWARNYAEFHDGRFEPVAATPYAQEPHGASVHPTTKETDK